MMRMKSAAMPTGSASSRTLPCRQSGMGSTMPIGARLPARRIAPFDASWTDSGPWMAFVPLP